LISKARLKDIKALHQPKFRQIYNKFIAEGDKVCGELLKNKKFNIAQVLITSGHEKKYADLLKYGTVEPDIISSKEMEQISTLKTPSDIFLLLDKKEDDVNILLNNKISAIYLDGVQDPGNVGTIIRTADWFGIDMIIRSEDSADFFSPKVVQASMGSIANLLLSSADNQKISSFKMPMYGTYMEGMDLQTTTIEENAILVMGSEGRGISAEMDQWIQHKITIVGAKNKLAESLNVSVAAGIICAHWKKMM
jgi:RNA methyltransferase, TrmH family